MELCQQLLLLGILSFASIPITVQAETEEILESPKITDFGQWGEFENCSSNWLVTGLRVRVEEYRRRPDNTALNSVVFSCGNPVYPVRQFISSRRGPFGRYQNFTDCPTYAKGFQLLSQAYRGRGKDDVAAINIKLICADDTEILGHPDPNISEHYPESGFTEQQICSEGKGICGLQTQVEGPQLFGDDTALNNIRVKCCSIKFGTTTTPTSTSTEASTFCTTPSSTSDTSSSSTGTTESVEESSSPDTVSQSTTNNAEEIASTTETSETTITSENRETTTDASAGTKPSVVDGTTESNPEELITSTGTQEPESATDVQEPEHQTEVEPQETETPSEPQEAETSTEPPETETPTKPQETETPTEPQEAETTTEPQEAETSTAQETETSTEP